jgi:DNA-directed RNA polymerase specialized sigma24 family protein
MSPSGSVSVLLGALRAGDASAAQALWEGYFHKLVALARDKLRGRPCAAADEEDVALSAFDSFCRGAAHSQFPRLVDRGDLWQLLVVLTARKAYRLLQHERRLKRGGGGVQHLSALEDEEAGLAEVIGREPTPEFAAQVAEECQRRLEALGDPILKDVALAKMEGHSNAEIARRLGCIERTIERKLRTIRNLWEEGSP